MSIWRYADSYNKIILLRYQLETSCGDTPLQQIFINGKPVLLKREDLNPTGSHKDRSLLYQLSYHTSLGENSFAISSSGNSVISAIHILKGIKDIKLAIFLSPKLSATKLARLVKVTKIEKIDTSIGIVSHENFTFHFTDKAVSDSKRYAKENGAVLLRGSQDSSAIEGFKSISYELHEERSDITDIFLPVSSGTTLVGIAEAQFEMGYTVHIHACQTEAVNIISREFDKHFEPKNTSIADSIVDRIGHRRAEVSNAIKKSNGTGWVVSDQEIKYALEILSREGIKCSAEGGMTVAAYLKASKYGYQSKLPVCLISGTA